VQEAVDRLAGQRGLDGSERGLLLRQAIGLRDRVDRGPDDGVIERLRDQLTKQVNLEFPAT
jgi:hypothetical protein